MFHLRVADRIGYACRLLRKAYAQDAQVVVCAPPSTLAKLDTMLWASDPASFIPHVRLAPDARPPDHLAGTPIWLVERAEQGPTHEVLLNLGDELVAGFEAFARVIEIVPQDVDAAQAARLRWKHYADRGYVLKHHEARA